MVFDLHCDLLSYLIMKENRDVFNDESRCSLNQLIEGKVNFQTLAVFAETKKGSSIVGNEQIQAFQKKHNGLPNLFNQKGIHLRLAFESASAFAEEDEPLSKSFERLDQYLKENEFLYVSLTWNTENRFGGGNLTSIGLKKDGEALLEYLSGKGVFIDLSHTSDKLAFDILKAIDAKGLDLQVIASHSNFRSVKDHPRNLPDDLALEIIRRQGLIGLNLFRGFVGDSFEDHLVKMVMHAKKLGGLKHLCFGADFFYDNDFTTSLSYPRPFFETHYDNASCYPKILSLLKKHCTDEELDDISHKNASRLIHVHSR